MSCKVGVCPAMPPSDSLEDLKPMARMRNLTAIGIRLNEVGEKEETEERGILGQENYPLLLRPLRERICEELLTNSQAMHPYDPLILRILESRNP
jgi:hypothetical protein